MYLYADRRDETLDYVLFSLTYFSFQKSKAKNLNVEAKNWLRATKTLNQG